jgi:hypothetical protein
MGGSTFPTVLSAMTGGDAISSVADAYRDEYTKRIPDKLLLREFCSIENGRQRQDYSVIDFGK